MIVQLIFNRNLNKTINLLLKTSNRNILSHTLKGKIIEIMMYIWKWDQNLHYIGIINK